ncbi:MAG: PilZ domain-containing protein [Solirubrobacteraceae bacterium]
MNARRQHATVVLPQFGAIPAFVELDGEQATAVLLARPLRPLADLVGEEVAIHVTTGRGLLRLDARIAAVGADDRLALEVHTRCDVVQRRAFARVEAFLEVFATAPPGSAKTIAAAVVNISASGAVISRLDGLSTGDAVDLRLALAPGEPPLEIGGRVVCDFDGGLRAVRFERLHDADRERLVRFVIVRQRLELKRASSA